MIGLIVRIRDAYNPLNNAGNPYVYTINYVF